jgi:hypothetical protein
MDLLDFDTALGKVTSTPHVLLGNGFSIACRPNIFTYGSLVTNADFSAVPNAPKLFQALGTNDFEMVIRALQSAAKLLRSYGASNFALADQMEKDAEELKKVLVQAIAGKHPDHPFEIDDNEYRRCRKFLSHFNRVYSLNYDILLYWALMRDEVDELRLKTNDGFTNSEIDPDADYVAWESFQSATVQYLHGALHLFDGGEELQKYTWNRTGIRIMDQIREALDHNLFPLFVAEGTSASKLEKINHSGYLHKALRSFSEIKGDLFIYGHSLAENDDHVLRKIEKNKVERLFVSIYGDPGSESNKWIIKRAQSIQSKRDPKRPLGLHFYSAESAHVWN